ncbi:MAG TPA: hypothetical protein VH500_06315 [Nitrososphaeraceae archaeon]|jgi:hypothetical protein
MAIKIKIKKEHKTILRRLYYDRIIDSRYTPIEELCKGVSCHTKGSMAEAANDLLKAEYLIPKRARYGLPVLLNPLKINEVKRILEAGI